MKAETKNQIDALATELKGQIEIKDGAATIAADAYVKTLPSDIPLETVKKLQEHNTVFWPAVTKAFGEAAIEAMAADKKIESLDLSVPMVGDDKWDINFKRSYEHMDMSTKEMKTSYGGVSASLTVQGARHNRGAMSSVKSDLKAKAMAQFAE